MQLINLLPTLLFLAPALSAPTPTSLNCDSLLSFDEAGQHSIISIRSFCNRRKQAKSATVQKRSVASVFDLPSVRSEQYHLRVEDDHHSEDHLSVPHFIEEESAPLTTSISPPSPFPEDDFNVYVFEAGSSIGHDDGELSQLQRTAQALARLQSSAYGSLRRQTHSLFVTILGMTSSLVIAGLVAVSFVVLVLIACERWLGAVLRWSRITSPAPTSSLYLIDEKIPVIVVTDE